MNRKQKKLTEDEIDEIVTAEADDESAWEKPIRVRRPAMEKPEDVLNRLVDEQGVTPVHNLVELSDLWPADDDPDALMNFMLEETSK